MIERRSVLGAGLAAIAGLFVWPFASKGSKGHKGHIEVEEQLDGWRVIKYNEGNTWFDVRFKLDPQLHPPEFPAFGVQRIETGESRVDLDWYRLRVDEPGGVEMFDAFVGATPC